MAYGKIFESLFTGSMIGSGCTVFALWSYVIANSKPPGTIELNPILLATVFGCSVAEVESAIEFLCSPDERSRTKDHDGRRLLREGQFLYAIPTWQQYNAIRNEIERREANREAQRRWRAKQKSVVSERNGVSDYVSEVSRRQPAPSSSTDTSTSTSGCSGTGEESTRGEGESPTARIRDAGKPDDVSAEVWADWVAHRKRKRASVTERVLSKTRIDAKAAGMTLEAALTHWVAQGYAGFFPPQIGPQAAPRVTADRNGNLKVPHSGFDKMDHGKTGAI